MARLNFRFDARPCMLSTPRRNGPPEESKALFHGFFQVAEVAAPSMVRGGHQGGQLADVQALIELEDGTLRLVEVSCIRFLDSAGCFDAYDGGETKRRNIRGLEIFFKQVTALPECNTCAVKNTCPYCPSVGQMTRYNCPLYEGGDADD